MMVINSIQKKQPCDDLYEEGLINRHIDAPTIERMKKVIQLIPDNMLVKGINGLISLNFEVNT